MTDLEHRFRAPKILEAMRAESLDRHERRQVVAAKIVRRLGKKCLAAVTGRE